MVELTAPKTERRVLVTILKSVVALLVSAGTLWWASRGFDMDAGWAMLKRTNGADLALYVASLIVIHFARVIRYWLLVRPLGNVSKRSVFSAVSVGLPAAFFLPLRLGELVRPLMISRAGVPLPSAVASVVVERVADALWNVGTFFILLQLLPGTADVDPLFRTAAQGALVMFGSGLAFLAVAYVARGPVLGLLERVVSVVSPKLAKALVGLTATFLDGLGALGTPLRIGAFFGLTALYWGLNGWGAWFIARSYGLDVPPMAGWFTIACVVFAVMVPAGPGYVGVYEIAFQAGMAPFKASPQEALVVGAVSHFVQLLMLALFAGIGFQTAEASQRAK